MDRAAGRDQVRKVLAKLEEKILGRIPRAYRLTPERLFRELAAFNLVLELDVRLEE